MARCTLAALSALALFVLSGCGSGTSEAILEVKPQEAEVPPPELTAGRARAALIELIRSPEPGDLKDFPLKQFAEDGIEGQPDWPSWGPFPSILKRVSIATAAVSANPHTCVPGNTEATSNCGKHGG